jgi:hypothetical protein
MTAIDYYGKKLLSRFELRKRKLKISRLKKMNRLPFRMRLTSYLPIRELQKWFRLGLLGGMLVYLIILRAIISSSKIQSHQIEIEFETVEKVKYNDIFNDLTVDTSSYEIDYNLLKSRMHNLQTDLGLSQPSPFKTIIQRNRSTKFLRKEKYLIVERTSYCSAAKYTDRNKTFVKECPYTNCEFTCDRSRWKSADALIFHENDLDTEMNSIEENMFLKRTMGHHSGRANQIWILRKEQVRSS